MAFQKGQKVRALVDVCYWESGSNIRKGVVYTVAKSLGDFVMIEGIARQWSIARFEPVVEFNPYVETVTKTVERVITEEVTEKRLKPGIYGNVRIGEDGTVYMRSQTGGNRFYADTSLKGLDETISALSAIRDFQAAQKK